MRGVNLRSLEVGDMLDVIHTLYEDDLIPLYEEHQKIKSQVREQMWRSLYEMEYKHPYDEGASAGVNYGGPATYKPGEMPSEESLLPDDMPGDKPLKAYVPPTDPSDFASILDAPLGDVPDDDE